MFVFIVITIVIILIFLMARRGYRERSIEIELEKYNQAKEKRIISLMKEYRTLINNEPAKPKDYPNNLVAKSYHNADDEWHVWHNNKMQFDGFMAFPFDEKSIAAKRVKDQINPPKKIKEKDLLETKRGISFRPYPNFESIINVITESKISFSENIENWESTTIQLTIAIKILKSIEFSYLENRNKYNILYRSKTFLSAHTVKFEYEKNRYTIIVNTGLKFSGNETEILNRPVSFKTLEDQYIKLLDMMEKQLPSLRFESILHKIRSLANN